MERDLRRIENRKRNRQTTTLLPDPYLIKCIRDCEEDLANAEANLKKAKKALQEAILEEESYRLNK